MSTPSLSVTLRTPNGKQSARKIRRQGIIPGVLYGSDMSTLSVGIPERTFEKIIKNSRKRLLDLEVAESDASKTYKVLIRSIQRDVVKHNILHIDFHAVDPAKKMQVQIPIKITGVAAGIAEGGLMHELTRSVLIRCLPDDLPEEITIDVTSLRLNQTFHVSDLRLPTGIECMATSETPIVTVSKREEEVPEGVAAAPTEVAATTTPAAPSGEAEK